MLSLICLYLYNGFWNINKPYIFGISCLTINIGRGYKIARILKLKYPDSTIIFGGTHPTVLPAEVLSVNDVDIVAKKEGVLNIAKNWYLDPKEYYYLIKLALKVLLNCIVVFNIKWFVWGMRKGKLQSDIC